MSATPAQPSLQAMLDDIAAAPPGFGGGAVAAGCLALAAGLIAVAARASVERWDGAGGAAAQANALQRRAAQLAPKNLAAYSAAHDALRPPEGAKVEAASLGPALALAADVPLRIGETASDAAQLAALVAREGDPDRRPDAIAAACIAEAVAAAALVLVEANLGVTPDDARAAEARASAAAAGAAREAAQRAAGQ